MGLFQKSCVVCDRGAAAIVDKLLDTGTRLRDIAQAVGINKSSIHRHSSRCYLKSQAAVLKSKRFDPRAITRIIAEWPERPGSPHRFTDGDREIPESELRASDLVLVVRYEQHTTFKNPPRKPSPPEDVQDADPTP